MTNTIGLFNSPAFPGKTLRILNGRAELVDLEQALNAGDCSSPDKVWEIITTAPGTPATESVLSSDTWIPRTLERTMWKLGYGLPDDWDYVGSVRQQTAYSRSVKDIAASAGISQRALARRFQIPYRTMEEWGRGGRNCPLYIRLMMQECLNLYHPENNK